MSSGNPAGDACVVAERLTYSLPDGRVLFEALDLACSRNRTALIGPNGCGKTTLVRLLSGELMPSGGTVRRLTPVAVLPQEFRPSAHAPLSLLLRIEGRLSALRRLEAGHGGVADVELVGDEWDLPARARKVLARYGLGHLPLDRPVGDVSGGEATRIALAGLALGRPDFLLLDEPTNHLDAASRQALYEFIEEWTGGMLVVSHDRTLLRRMDRIVELAERGLQVYGGDYDDYRARRAEADAAAERELAGARASLRRAERKAREVRERQARRDARGRRGRAAGGVPKVLLNTRKANAERTGARVLSITSREVAERRERLDAARRQVEERESPRFDLQPTELPSKRRVLELAHVTVRFPGTPRPVLEDISLTITGPERVAVAGPNGSGKTTLLEVAVGRRPPDDGSVHRLPDDHVAWMDQSGLDFDPERSVLDNFRRFHPYMEGTAVRYALARFLFSREAAMQPAGSLSGGQRLRASLACVLGGARPPSLLVLDEPDNHLDFDALEALESALREYDGALLVVSHDEDFLEAIGIERTIALEASGGPGSSRLRRHSTIGQTRGLVDSRSCRPSQG